MTVTNFIPTRRRVLRQQRRRRRIWTVVCVAYALPLIGLSATAWMLVDDNGSDYTTQLRLTIGHIEQTREAIRRTNQRLSPARARLVATEAISLRPDWSILLAQVAKQMGEDVFLSRVELAQSKAKSPVPAETPASPVRPYTLTVGGYGRTQTAVSDFVVQLEATPLFEKVTILQTDRKKLMADEAISFELLCQLGGTSPEAP